LLRPCIWGVPATLLVVGCLGVEAHGGVFASRTLARLGDASYSLYLIHLPASAIVAHTLGVANAWLFIPAAIAVSVAAGLACHRWVEVPLIHWTRSLGAVQRLSFASAAHPGYGHLTAVSAPPRARFDKDID